MKKIMHGWYSEKQGVLGGIVRYKTPEGSLVDVTSVTQTKNDISNWDDMIYVGEITEMVERLTKGEVDFDDIDDPEELLKLAKIINGDDVPIPKDKLN